MSSNDSKDRIKRFMKKKIDPSKININKGPSQEEKTEFIKRKLFSAAPQETFINSIDGQVSHKSSDSFLQKLRKRVNMAFLQFDGRGFKTFRRDTLPFLVFMGFSTFIVYKMETDYDKMAKTITKSRSQKQLIAEDEDMYIRAHLVSKDKLEKNQIQDVPDRKQQYNYEKFQDIEDDEDGDFNTKEDFYDLLRKDYNKGMKMPDQYSEAVQQYSQQAGKRLKKYGEFDEGEEDEEEEQEEDRQDMVIRSQGNSDNDDERRRRKEDYFGN